jgi:DNA-binding MarR family transcriptional regulator
MSDINKLLSPLFLEEQEIRKLIELLFFSYRDFTFDSNIVLEKINFTRTHYRVIYFVGKQKKITIKELLKILQITKQNLSRVLDQLVKNEYINMEIGYDKRSKNLTLTNKGFELEKKLSDIQIKKIKKIIRNSEVSDINGFKKILFSMIDSEGKEIFNRLNK